MDLVTQKFDDTFRRFNTVHES